MIYQKIYQITHDLPAMMKRTPGHNGVKYRKLEDLLEVIVPRLEFFKIILTASEIKFFETKAASSKKGEVVQHVSYVQRFTFLDIEDGTSLEIDVPTEATDASNTSKACRMANTTAMRTLFETVFLMTESETEQIEKLVELPVANKIPPPLEISSRFESGIPVSFGTTSFKEPIDGKLVEMDYTAAVVAPIEEPKKQENFEDNVFSAKTPEEKEYFTAIIMAILKDSKIDDPDKVLARKIWKTVLAKKPLKKEVEYEIFGAIKSLGNFDAQSTKQAS